MKFNDIKRRLARFERPFVKFEGPWPPNEGSFAHILWTNLGQPAERMGFGEMYEKWGEEFWKRATSEADFGEGAEAANDSQD